MSARILDEDRYFNPQANDFIPRYPEQSRKPRIELAAPDTAIFEANRLKDLRETVEIDKIIARTTNELTEIIKNLRPTFAVAEFNPRIISMVEFVNSMYSEINSTNTIGNQNAVDLHNKHTNSQIMDPISATVLSCVTFATDYAIGRTGINELLSYECIPE